MTDMKGRVLVIAGSDSGGGAGIQADIKTITALGGFAMTAVTALTAQNTQGVHGIHDVPAEFVADQMRVVLGDIGADCIKIGMLHRPEIIETVADVLAEMAGDVPLVLDPVMVAKGGASLLAEEAEAALKTRLLSRARVITPNVPEAEVLSGQKITARSDIPEAMQALRVLGPEAVLLTGGHLEDDAGVVDFLSDGDDYMVVYEAERIDTPNTHGTGCTLASAIACGLAQGMGLPPAVARAREYVREAIQHNPNLGHGHGPLNHAVTVKDI